MPDSMTAGPEALAVLREIRDELRALRGAMAGRGAQVQVDTATADLLRVIVASVGDHVFSCADLTCVAGATATDR